MVELSVQVQNKLSVADKVIASARTHGPKIAIIIAERAKTVQGPDTKVTVEAVGAVIDVIADNVVYANTVLREAELKYFGEKVDDPPIRVARDNTVVDIAGMLAQLRTHIEGTLGASETNKYGLKGEIPRTPHRLVSYTQNVTKQLDQYPQQVTTALGVSFNTAPASIALKSKLDELAALVNDDNREARELEEAQVARNRAADAWSDAYQGAASTFEGLYRTAGYTELANRVRPTQRKVRGEDPGEDTTAPAAPPAGTEGP